MYIKCLIFGASTPPRVQEVPTHRPRHKVETDTDFIKLVSMSLKQNFQGKYNKSSSSTKGGRPPTNLNRHVLHFIQTAKGATN